MVSVKKVYPAMFEEIYPLLKEFDASGLPKKIWENTFKYNWSKEEDYCGYALFHGDKVVGFLGLIFSQRTINNKLEKFCNLHTWYVQEDFRDYSLSLLMPALRLKDYTFTDLSASDGVFFIAKKLGFQVLDSRIVVVFPLPYFTKSAKKNDFKITQDKAFIDEHIRGEDRKIFADNNIYSCCHLLLHSGQNYCYIIYTIHEDQAIRYAHIQYLSNRELFGQYSREIYKTIARLKSCKLVAVDQRQVENLKIPLSLTLPIHVPRLYKSSSLAPEAIDNLYSETVLLNFIGMISWKDIRQGFFNSIKKKLAFAKGSRMES